MVIAFMPSVIYAFSNAGVGANNKVLIVRAQKSGSKAVRLTWITNFKAASYQVKAGSKVIATVTSKKYTITKIGKKKLKKKQNVKNIKVIACSKKKGNNPIKAVQTNIISSFKTGGKEKKVTGLKPISLVEKEEARFTGVKNAKYYFSDNSAVKVTNKGFVKGNREGTAKVYAVSATGHFKKCEVCVIAKENKVDPYENIQPGVKIDVKDFECPLMVLSKDKDKEGTYVDCVLDDTVGGEFSEDIVDSTKSNYLVEGMNMCIEKMPNDLKVALEETECCGRSLKTLKIEDSFDDVKECNNIFKMGNSDEPLWFGCNDGDTANSFKNNRGYIRVLCLEDLEKAGEKCEKYIDLSKILEGLNDFLDPSSYGKQEGSGGLDNSNYESRNSKLNIGNVVDTNSKCLTVQKCERTAKLSTGETYNIFQGGKTLMFTRVRLDKCKFSIHSKSTEALRTHVITDSLGAFYGCSVDPTFRAVSYPMASRTVKGKDGENVNVDVNVYVDSNMWYKQVCYGLGLQLEKENTLGGSAICLSSVPFGCFTDKKRITHLSEDDEVVIVYGGYNDAGQLAEANKSKGNVLGTYQKNENEPIENMPCKNFAEGFQNYLKLLRRNCPSAQILFILPPYDNSPRVLEGCVDKVNNLMIEILNDWGISFVDLRECTNFELGKGKITNTTDPHIGYLEQSQEAKWIVDEVRKNNLLKLSRSE